MNIYGFIPFSHERNYGKAYNNYCRLVPNSDDWIFVTDGDMMFLTPDYEIQLKELIQKYPDTGMFTCLNNRAGTPPQIFGGKCSEDGDIRKHRKIAIQCQATARLQVENTIRSMSGYFMMFKKSTWEKVHFREVDKMILGVDTNFCHDLLANGFNIKIAKGVYVFHYYRLLEGANYRNHLL